MPKLQLVGGVRWNLIRCMLERPLDSPSYTSGLMSLTEAVLCSRALCLGWI